MQSATTGQRRQAAQGDSAKARRHMGSPGRSASRGAATETVKAIRDKRLRRHIYTTRGRREKEPESCQVGFHFNRVRAAVVRLKGGQGREEMRLLAAASRDQR